MATEIQIGDYICSDFFSPMQGFVKGNGQKRNLSLYYKSEEGK